MQEQQGKGSGERGPLLRVDAQLRLTRYEQERCTDGIYTIDLAIVRTRVACNNDVSSNDCFS